MAKRTIAANAEKLGTNDVATPVGAIKYISDYKENHFMLPKVDAAGNKTYHTDANGNNKLPDYTEYHFTKISGHKNKDGKIDPNTAFCYFIVDPAVHGSDFQRIVDMLEKNRLNPKNKIYTEDDYFRKRNPEASRIAMEKEEIMEKLSEKDKQIEELKAKLGFRK